MRPQLENDVAGITQVQLRYEYGLNTMRRRGAELGRRPGQHQVKRRTNRPKANSALDIPASCGTELFIRYLENFGILSVFLSGKGISAWMFRVKKL